MRKGAPDGSAQLTIRDSALPLTEQDVETPLERLAANPSTDVDKLGRMIEMKYRDDARKAERAFNAAMTLAQAEMRPVVADASNPQTKSRYASYEALDRALRPLYTMHGFGLSFDTGDGAADQWVRVQCYVTHRDGHSRTYHADIPADGKGAKGGDVMTKTHAVGSAMSYGMRYLLKMIFNVAVGEGDDDGNAAGRKPIPPAPEGFDNWLIDMTAVADDGTKMLQSAFARSKVEYRKHVTEHLPDVWASIKAKAAKVQA